MDICLHKIRHKQLSRRTALKSLLICAGTSTLAWTSWRHTPLPSLVKQWTAPYQTKTGEIRKIILADDTHIWMNTASAFDSKIYNNEHHIVLLRGEILVETSKSARHLPLFVNTSYGQLQPLGTRF